MPEVAHAGKYHGHTRFVRRGDYFFIAHRTTGLDHRCDPALGSVVDAIAEGEERIRGHDRAFDLESRVFRFDRSDAS